MAMAESKKEIVRVVRGWHEPWDRSIDPLMNPVRRRRARWLVRVPRTRGYRHVMPEGRLRAPVATNDTAVVVPTVTGGGERSAVMGRQSCTRILFWKIPQRGRLVHP